MSKIILQEYISPSSANSKIFMEDGTDAFGEKKKHCYMEGIFIQGNIKNANERIYPTDEIARAVKTIQDQLKDNYSICGEIDHPDDLKINLDRVSHIIIAMKMDGNDGTGKLKLLPTPMGELAQKMLQAGVRLGVSSRGSGNVDDFTGKVSDFEIITVDIVAQPSAPAAYPKAVYESLLNMKYGHNYIDNLKGMNLASDSKVQKYIVETVTGIIKDMKL
jgi:hypothetical protein